MITDVYTNLSEFMTTDEIASAWEAVNSDIACAVSTIMEAVNNRLSDLDFDEEEYEDGSNEEIEKLLTIRDELDSLNI